MSAVRARRQGTASPHSRVFINCPYDKHYERLFLALVSGVVAVGCEPHCVLELPAGARLERILKLIQDCGASLHDLSRVSRTGKGRDAVPRFNMPFEAGLAYAHSEASGGKHSFLVLEEVRFRIQRSTSDLNGIDPFIHHGTVEGMLSCVRNALVAKGATYRPTMEKMLAVARGVEIAMARLRRTREVATYFDANAFELAVGTASALAEQEGLLPK